MYDTMLDCLRLGLPSPPITDDGITVTSVPDDEHDGPHLMVRWDDPRMGAETLILPLDNTPDGASVAISVERLRRLNKAAPKSLEELFALVMGDTDFLCEYEGLIYYNARSEPEDDYQGGERLLVILAPGWGMMSGLIDQLQTPADLMDTIASFYIELIGDLGEDPNGEGPPYSEWREEDQS